MTLFGLLLAPLEIITFILFIVTCGIGITTARHRAFGWTGGSLVASFALVSYLLWDQLKGLVASYGIVQTVLLVLIGWLLAGVVSSFIYWVFFVWEVRDNYERLMLEFKENRARLSKPDVKNEAFSIAKVYNLFVSEDKRSNETPSEWKQRLSDEAEAAAAKITPEFQQAYRKVEHVNDHRNSIFTYFGPYDFERDMFDMPSTKSLAKLMLNIDPLSIDAPQTMLTLLSNILPPKFLTHKNLIISAGSVWPFTLLSLVFSNILERLIERLVSMLKGAYDLVSRLAFGKFEV